MAPTRSNMPHNGPSAAGYVRFPTPAARLLVDSGAPHPGPALIPGPRGRPAIGAHHGFVKMSDRATCPLLTAPGELNFSRDEAMQS